MTAAETLRRTCKIYMMELCEDGFGQQIRRQLSVRCVTYVPVQCSNEHLYAASNKVFSR